MKRSSGEHDAKQAKLGPTGNRKLRGYLNAERLVERAENQARLDEAEPLERRASLMDVVTAFAPMIAARKDAKWSDPEICAWLVELGYKVDVPTLRTYRSRLGISAAGLKATRADCEPTPKRSVARVATGKAKDLPPVAGGVQASSEDHEIEAPVHPKRPRVPQRQDLDDFDDGV